MSRPVICPERRAGESASALAERLLKEFVQGHQQNHSLTVEKFLVDLAHWQDYPGLVLDLLIAEWDLRGKHGPSPDADNFIRRFPEWERDIRELANLTLEVTAYDRAVAASLPWHRAATPTFPIPFGKYRLMSLKGSGGMARVFLTDQSVEGKPIAVKIPWLPEHPEGAGPDPEMLRKRFARESRVMETLDHPNLVKLLDVGEVEGVPYFAMPFYPDGSLADELDGGEQFMPEDAARVIAAVARGLQHAHERGVVHRDLKPANLLLDGERVIVTDFGLACDLDEDTKLTQSGALIGTPSYLSPQQVEGQPTTQASDIFSLGVVFREMLVGVTPFRGTILEVLAQIREVKVPPLAEVCPNLPAAVVAICEKAMARLPADRYLSMNEFADDLERFLAGTWQPATDVATTAAVEEPQKPGRTRWWMVVSLLGLAVAGGLWFAENREKSAAGLEEIPPAPAPQPSERPIVSKRKQIGLRGQLQLVHEDLNGMEATERPHIRYLSLMAVHDNPYLSDAEYSLHLDALRLVLNRLSKAKRDVPVLPLGENGAVLRIDFRDLGWIADDEWRALREAEPCGVRYDAINPDESIRKLARETYSLASVDSLFDNPIVRGDWVAVAASESPLFDRLVGTDPRERKVPPFDLTDARNGPLVAVRRLYQEFPVDKLVAAAELGVAEIPARDEFTTVPRMEWAGGRLLFQEWVRKLRLGSVRSIQPTGK